MKWDIWEFGICICGIDVAVITFIVIVLFMGPFIILLAGHLARVHHYHYNLTNIILIIVFFIVIFIVIITIHKHIISYLSCIYKQRPL